jgi:hypothetical protein
MAAPAQIRVQLAMPLIDAGLGGCEIRGIDPEDVAGAMPPRLQIGSLGERTGLAR